MAETKLREIRRALADYMHSEGCSCCQNREAHEEARERLGKLLNVRKVKGYRDFYRFRTQLRRLPHGEGK